MHQESIMNEQNSGKNFEGIFDKLFKLKIMHQESIMNEQNLFIIQMDWPFTF